MRSPSAVRTEPLIMNAANLSSRIIQTKPLKPSITGPNPAREATNHLHLLSESARSLNWGPPIIGRSLHTHLVQAKHRATQHLATTRSTTIHRPPEPPANTDEPQGSSNTASARPETIRRASPLAELHRPTGQAPRHNQSHFDRFPAGLEACLNSPTTPCVLKK